MIKRYLLLFLFLFCLPVSAARAQTLDAASTPAYFIAELTSDGVSTTQSIAGIQETTTVYKATIIKGEAKGTRIEVEQSDLFAANRVLKVKTGDKVVIIQSMGDAGLPSYQLVDAYRVPSLWWMAVLFFFLAVLFGRLKGFSSMIGLAVSAWIIVGLIVPKIVAGADPLLVSLLGSLLIATISLFLAHGFTKRTTVAFVGTVVTLILSAGLAVAAVRFTHLFGMGSEASLFVIGDLPGINLQGLLLGGIMLGLLGVLDDITTAQSAVVDELKRANRQLTFRELYYRGLSVGREHIASLVNTLFLAYAGASLPLFLLFSVNQGQELWMIFNNEMIAEEIVRTLVGSAGLILAVPITTALAAYIFRHQTDDPNQNHPYHHH